MFKCVASFQLRNTFADICVQNQILGVDDRNNWNELQSNLCGVAIVRSIYLVCVVAS